MKRLAAFVIILSALATNAYSQNNREIKISKAIGEYCRCMEQSTSKAEFKKCDAVINGLSGVLQTKEDSLYCFQPCEIPVGIQWVKGLRSKVRV